MSVPVQDNWKYFGGAIAIHALLALAMFGIAMNSRNVVIPQLAIQGVLVDRNSLNPPVKPPSGPTAEELQHKQQEQEAEQLKQQQAQQEKQREATQLKVGQLKAHEVELKHAAELQQQQDAQRKATEAQAKHQQQELEQRRLEFVKQKQHEIAQQRQAEADAKAQAAREAELKAQLAAEEGQAQAVNAGVQAQWEAQVQQKIIRSWIKPPSASAGVDCDVRVTQAMGGTVLSAQVTRCNGDAAVRQSIENAALSASPLPQPTDSRVFTRTFTLHFVPKE